MIKRFCDICGEESLPIKECKQIPMMQFSDNISANELVFKYIDFDGDTTINLLIKTEVMKKGEKTIRNFDICYNCLKKVVTSQQLHP